MSEVYKRTEEPQGTVPRQARYLMIGGIAVVILAINLFSGRSQSKPSDSKLPNIPTSSARPADLQAFKKWFEQQQHIDARKRQAASAQATQIDAAPQGHLQRFPAPAPRFERDPAEEIERQRQVRAPFASVKVISVKDKEEITKEQEPVVVYRAETPTDTGAQKPADGVTALVGSGQFLPEREGSLYRLYEGTLVRTVLMNRLDGTFTGPVKCIVSEPVLARDSRVLIPIGAVFLGEAKRVEERNQRRLAVWFDRLLLPNGYSVPLENTPGLNNRGETGLIDITNNHYLRRFSLAGAIGLLGGLTLYGGRTSPFGYPGALTASLGGVATNDLSRRMNDLPTITIREGHIVDVYLSSDLLVPEYRAQKGNM